MIETAKNGANLSDEEIKEEVDTIMFEVINIIMLKWAFLLMIYGNVR